MQYEIPSSTWAIAVWCSYCDHKSYGTPDKIPLDKIQKWRDHVCDESLCNGFNCKKHLLIDEIDLACEFYVVDETSFACFRCVSNIKASPQRSIRPYWKLPARALLFVSDDDRIKARTTESIRDKCPYLYEDLWYAKYYSKLTDHRKKQDDIHADYTQYLSLVEAGIILQQDV